MWFSFGPDSECLIESIRAFRSTFKDSIITICDDKSNSITKEVVKLIKPDYYEKRSWNSHGNLNGYESVYGILNHQINMHSLFPGHDGAIKVDCDTSILGSNWINRDSPISGVDLGTTTFFAGMARYMRNDVPEAIKDLLDNKFTWNSVMVPEDQLIANCAMLLYGKECNRNDWVKCAGSYSFKNPEYNDRFVEIMTFGNRSEILEGSKCDKRTIAAIHMAKYNSKFIDTSNSLEYEDFKNHSISTT